MKRKDPLIVGRNSVRDMHHLRLMALLQELVRTWGYTGTARVLEIDPRTVASSVQSGQLTHRVRESLQRALQHGVGSAADRQRERSDKLEARLDKLEGQLKELKGDLKSGLKVLNKLGARLDKTEGQVKELKGDRRTGLKGLRMSLDGVRKYYGVQRRLIEQRLLALEAGRDGTETGSPAGDGSGDPGTRSVAAGTGYAGERTSGVVDRDTPAPLGGGDARDEAPSEPGIPGSDQVPRRNVARSESGERDVA